MHSFFLVLAVLFGFVTQCIGMYAIYKGTYKPQRMTRFIYLLLSILFLGTLYTQGSREAFFLAGIQCIGVISIFVLSLKYGMGGTSKLDIGTFFGFLMGVLVWKVTANPTLALYVSIFIECIGFIPTLEKIWRLPNTEDWRFYFSDVLAGFFSLLSISILSVPNIVYPLYIFVLNISAVILIVGRRRASAT